MSPVDSIGSAPSGRGRGTREPTRLHTEPATRPASARSMRRDACSGAISPPPPCPGSPNPSLARATRSVAVRVTGHAAPAANSRCAGDSVWSGGRRDTIARSSSVRPSTGHALPAGIRTRRTDRPLRGRRDSFVLARCSLLEHSGRRASDPGNAVVSVRGSPVVNRLPPGRSKHEPSRTAKSPRKSAERASARPTGRHQRETSGQWTATRHPESAARAGADQCPGSGVRDQPSLGEMCAPPFHVKHRSDRADRREQSAHFPRNAPIPSRAWEEAVKLVTRVDPPRVFDTNRGEKEQTA